MCDKTKCLSNEGIVYVMEKVIITEGEFEL
jgi:hypothetical protein